MGAIAETPILVSSLLSPQETIINNCMQIANTNTFAKIAAVVAGLGLVAMTFVAAAPAKAQTTTTTTTMTAGTTFNFNQTIGSRGASVTALQNFLISKGYSIPAGPTGYFGLQTKAAVRAYQVTNSIAPALGYFGPLTRASVNAMLAGGGSTTTTTSTVPGCGAGAAFSSTTGAACGGTSTGGSTSGITTIGVEGSINIEKESAGLATTIYEGDSKMKLLGVRIEAKDSDVNFSRVRVDLGTTTDFYTKQFSKVYLMDDTGTVLASKDLNSSNVTRVSGTPVAYYVTLAGFTSTIKKNVKRSYFVAFDAYPSISAEYRTGSKTIAFYGGDAIRVTDGAGLDQYSSGANSITQVYNISASLSDNARLTVSTDPAVRKATTIVADQGANNNEKDKEEIGSFRLLAEKDAVLLRDLDVTVASSTVAGGTLQTLYLYDGSTAVATASAVSPAGTLYHFTSINQTLTRDVYKTYTLKADFRSITSGKTWTVGAVTVVSAESKGTGRTLPVLSSLGAGAGEAMSVVANGVTVTPSTPTISITSSKNTSGVTTEAHLTSVFNLNFTAVGSDAVFGAPATAFTFVLLKNGVATTTTVGSRTVFYPATQPTGTTGYSATGFTIPRNATVSIPVTFKVDANTQAAVDSDLTSGTYSVRLNTITYTSNAVSVSNDYSTNVNYTTAGFDRP